MWPITRRRRSNHDADIAREMADHLELEAAERRAAGAADTDARDAARRAFGNVTLAHEDTRAVWTWRALGRIAQDVRYAVRSPGHSPAFTLVTLAILTLGIGANTTIFSIVNSMLLRPLPYHEPERLMMLDERLPPRFEHFEASPLDVLAWREKGRAFESIAAYVGYAVGLVAALAVTRVLSTLLYEIEPRDPVTLGAAAALLSATALAAAFVPAYRAARVDPMTALRAE